jgi:hypothetical protein
MIRSAKLLLVLLIMLVINLPRADAHADHKHQLPLGFNC